jgi:hypothetical protein
VSNKEYLGDSVYVENIGYAIRLTTENGLPTDPSNEIFVEPEVVAALIHFAAVHGFISQAFLMKEGDHAVERQGGR